MVTSRVMAGVREGTSSARTLPARRAWLCIGSMTEPAVSSKRSRGHRGLLSVLASPRLLWRFLRDPHSPWTPKALVLLAIVYVVMPVDLIPDLVPVLGWLDDLGMTALALGYVASQAAKYELTEGKSAPAGGAEAITVKPTGA